MSIKVEDKRLCKDKHLAETVVMERDVLDLRIICPTIQCKSFESRKGKHGHLYGVCKAANNKTVGDSWLRRRPECCPWRKNLLKKEKGK